MRQFIDLIDEDFNRGTTAHKPLASVTLEDCAKAMLDAPDLRDVLEDGYVWQDCYYDNYPESKDPPPVPASSAGLTPDMLARLVRVLGQDDRFVAMRKRLGALVDQPSIKINRRLNRLSDLAKPLGVHWSAGHELLGGDTEHFGPHVVYAEVASKDVDWITTVTRGMFWWEVEQEITPVAGAPITLIRIDFGPDTKGSA